MYIYTHTNAHVHTQRACNKVYSYSLHMANFIYIAVAPSIYRKLLIMIYYIATSCHMLQ